MLPQDGTFANVTPKPAGKNIGQACVVPSRKQGGWWGKLRKTGSDTISLHQRRPCQRIGQRGLSTLGRYPRQGGVVARGYAQRQLLVAVFGGGYAGGIFLPHGDRARRVVFVGRWSKRSNSPGS